MLRAIGAQIEKTTNREACRDLSGRRLRDIREEKRLRDWATKQPEREEEARLKREEKSKRYVFMGSLLFRGHKFERGVVLDWRIHPSVYSRMIHLKRNTKRLKS